MKQKIAFQAFLGLMVLQVGILSVHCQTNVAITIDDVPNTQKYQAGGFHSLLLDNLDSVNIPVAVFVIEGQVYKTDSRTRNIELLSNWASKEYTTHGNHTFGHSQYSEVGMIPL